MAARSDPSRRDPFGRMLEVGGVLGLIGAAVLQLIAVALGVFGVVVAVGSGRVQWAVLVLSGVWLLACAVYLVRYWWPMVRR